MQEYRFSGVSLAGEPVRGTIFAPGRRAAERRIGDLSEKHQFQPERIERRYTYLYKVRRPDGKIAKGEQRAYSEEELRSALARMDLEVLSIQRKVLDFHMKPASADLVMFVRLAANMLRRHLPFDEILNLLYVDTTSASLRHVIRDLSSDLKGGMDGWHAFMKHQNSLGKFTAYMLGLASVSGNMAEMFEATARYLERKDEFRKSIRSALITPMVTFLAALAAFVWYIWFIIPEMVGLFANFNIQLPPFTQASLNFAAWLDNNYLWFFTLNIGLIVAAVLWSKTTKGRLQVHRYMIRIPYLGPLLHKLNLEIFCRVFSVLYNGSGENHEVLKIAAEATGNTYIEKQVKSVTIPMMMASGVDLVPAMEAAEVFLPMTIARFRSGVESGSVRESADEMAEFYEKETTLKLNAAVETIKTAMALTISVLVALLTVISAETAFIQPNASDIMFNR